MLREIWMPVFLTKQKLIFKSTYLVATGTPFFKNITVDMSSPKYETKTPNMSPGKSKNRV